jgi:hypothetical protein
MTLETTVNRLVAGSNPARGTSFPKNAVSGARVAIRSDLPAAAAVYCLLS